MDQIPLENMDKGCSGHRSIFIGYAPWLYFFYAGLKMSAEAGG